MSKMENCVTISFYLIAAGHNAESVYMAIIVSSISSLLYTCNASISLGMTDSLRHPSILSALSSQYISPIVYFSLPASRAILI